MRNTFRGNRCLLVVLSAALVLSLGACGSANANATPTLTVQEIFTAAIETFSAQQATQLALTPPTGTPTPTLFPTLAALSPLPTFSFTTPTAGGGGATGCDSAVYVSDVTIPDNTVMAAGKSFVKTWSLLNNGSCAWSTSYKMSFVTGDLMGGADTPLALAVPAGQQGQVSASLVAPTLAGTYTGNWRMKNAAGLTFGNVVTVVIKVGSGSGPTATAGTPGATITISGNAGVANASIDYNGTGSNADGNVTADGDGFYSFTVASGWAGTVRPSLTGETFNPDHLVYTNVNSDQANQDYDATP